MKQYSEVNEVFTNIDFLKQFFPKAEFIENDIYDLKNGYDIEWTGENEVFVVNRTYLDNQIGYVTDDQIFCGNIEECLKFILKSEA
jgi:hypothetical protein